MPTTVNEWITTKEAATSTGLNESRIRQLLLDGTITGTKVGQTLWLVDPSSLHRYMQTDRKPGPKRGV